MSLLAQRTPRIAPTARRKIAVLGSTGSIGVSTLDIVRRFPEQFEVVALSAGSNVALLSAQAREFSPRYVGIADSNRLSALRHELKAFEGELCGEPAVIDQFASLPEVDIVVAAVVGFTGIGGVLHAVRAGKIVALANKESLVAAGGLITETARSSGAVIVPVDSEHSALFQLMQAERTEDLHSIVLTASGGPFLTRPLDTFDTITPAEAARHPRWNMGAKITVDSATMVNKALEIAEASWLFGLPEDRIDAVIHPQSIVHSLVRLHDGSLLAHLGVPDMRIPIAYALRYPEGRLAGVAAQLDLLTSEDLQFRRLDSERFPAPVLMRECLRSGQSAAAAFTIANDLAVERFLKGALPFTGIISFVREVVERFAGEPVSSLDALLTLQQSIVEFAGAGDN